MARKQTREEFIQRANIIHNNKYDYSKVNYINSHTKVEIICSKHGSFWQTPNSHIQGCGCPCCSGVHRYSTEEFIQRANIIHNNKYDYSKVNYINNITKVKIVCPEHGSFWQRPSMHIYGNGCPRCNSNCKQTEEEFIQRARKIHNNKYDYSKVNYINNITKVKIVCPIHGEFLQTPNMHTSQKNGCPKCGIKSAADKIRGSLDIFIQNAKKVHGNKYDYSKVNYIRNDKKVEIICFRHGSFFQTPGDHTRGEHGCPKCHESKGEQKIRIFLEKENIKYSYQHKFEDCKDKKSLPFDFYLPDYNICIEYDGLQHFIEDEFYTRVNKLSYIQYHDQLKNQYCKDKGITLIRIPYYKKNDVNNIIKEVIK